MNARRWRLDQYDRKGSVIARVPLDFDADIVEKRLRTAELLRSSLLNVLGLGHRIRYHVYARRCTPRPIGSPESRRLGGMRVLGSSLGEPELRGFEDPVKLWELLWRDDQ